MQDPKLIIDHDSLERLDIPIFIKNTEGIYIFCNQAFVDFLGISRKNILGHTAYDIAPKKLADIYAEADKELLNSANQQSYSSTVQAAETETRVTFNKSIIYTKQHDVAGFVGAIESHTDIKRDTSNGLKKLTSRELGVLELLAKGRSVKAIASILGISNHTVADHLKSIYIKLDAHSKNEAVFKALSLFAISP